MTALQLTELELKQFRNHAELKLQVSPGVTVLTGRNGAGKTSVLEAIHILLAGSSFRGGDKDIVQYGHDSYKVSASMTNQLRTASFQVDSLKSFSVDGVTSKRLPVKHRYPVVLFEPDDMQLISGSPSRRRRYLDKFIGGYNTRYLAWLSRYDRALRQRNSLLKKSNLARQELFAWNVLISDYGSKITQSRQEAITLISSRIKQAYAAISGKSDEIKVAYSGEVDASAEFIHKSLERAYEYDLATGSTSVGPHRHDMMIDFNGLAASSNASRGEIRSIILGLKNVQASILHDKTNRAPLLLFDDVFSELDETRQARLINYNSQSQIIITSVSMPSSSVGNSEFIEIKL